MNLKKLYDPFPVRDIEWRVKKSGVSNGKPWAMVMAYVTNRAIMERLDHVCGQEGWQNEFKEYQAEGCLCGISIKIGDEWITKWDGAPNTAYEPIKGGISGAEKRAGVPWGIGRYLYKLPVTFVNHNEKLKMGDKGVHRDWIKVKDGKDVMIMWKEPDLPEWALPKGKPFWNLLQEVGEIKKHVDESEYYGLMWDMAKKEKANELTVDELEKFKVLLTKAADRNDRFTEKMKYFEKILKADDYKKVLKDLKAMTDPFFIRDKVRQIEIVEAMNKIKGEK